MTSAAAADVATGATQGLVYWSELLLLVLTQLNVLGHDCSRLRTRREAC